MMGMDKAIFMRLVRIATGNPWWWIVKVDRGIHVARVGSYPVWTGNKNSTGTGTTINRGGLLKQGSVGKYCRITINM